MGTKVDIMGVAFDTITREQAKQKLIMAFKGNRCICVYTPNPEMVMEAQKDHEFMAVLQRADLVVPDGIGIVLASYLTQTRIKERVAGYDLVQSLLKEMPPQGYSCYFLGGSPGVVEQAAYKMKQKYKGLQIVGSHHGYFSEEEEQSVIDEIQRLRPDLLLVGLGFPRQEKWIDQYRHTLPVKVCIGVGGSFDGMAGKVKRAPVLFQRLGLEWFYRLVAQPTRAKRMVQLPIFAWNMIGFSMGCKKEKK